MLACVLLSGCPFRHSDPELLKQKLQSYKISPGGIHQVGQILPGILSNEVPHCSSVSLNVCQASHHTPYFLGGGSQSLDLRSVESLEILVLLSARLHSFLGNKSGSLFFSVYFTVSIRNIKKKYIFRAMH